MHMLWTVHCPCCEQHGQLSGASQAQLVSPRRLCMLIQAYTPQLCGKGTFNWVGWGPTVSITNGSSSGCVASVRSLAGCPGTGIVTLCTPSMVPVALNLSSFAGSRSKFRIGIVFSSTRYPEPDPKAVGISDRRIFAWRICKASKEPFPLLRHSLHICVSPWYCSLPVLGSGYLWDQHVHRHKLVAAHVPLFSCSRKWDSWLLRWTSAILCVEGPVKQLPLLAVSEPLDGVASTRKYSRQLGELDHALLHL